MNDWRNCAATRGLLIQKRLEAEPGRRSNFHCSPPARMAFREYRRNAAAMAAAVIEAPCPMRLCRLHANWPVTYLRRAHRPWDALEQNSNLGLGKLSLSGLLSFRAKLAACRPK